MKEVWQLVNDRGLSYDEAVDIVAAERKRQEAEYQELQRVKHG